MERYELAKNRIMELETEIDGAFGNYIKEAAHLFVTIFHVMDGTEDAKQRKEWTDSLYEEIAGDNYETSYANPAYCVKKFGEKTGQYLCWFYARFRDSIVAAFEEDEEEVTRCMELFLQVVSVLSLEEETERYLKETIYYDVHDYAEDRIEKNIHDLLCSEETLIYNIVMKSDFANTDYLYRYGEYVTENEIRMAEFLGKMPIEKLSAMASTYTEGYRKGFEIAGIDLMKKKTVQIRYHIGFEPMVRQAVLQFEKMGLKPVFTRKTNTQAVGVVSTSPNKQYQYDHRFDDALYLNHALVQERLKISEKVFESYREEASLYAGPAVIEVFGEKLFSPKVKKESPAYKKEQEELSVSYRRDYSLLQNRYIPQDSYSFTIIAYPIPEIGEDFEDIFEETVKVNTLDMEEYKQIQQHLIDALDLGEKVHVTGRGKNHTDIWISLHELTEPAKQTNFENCLADVNIPLGEVFTSPVLTGTEGILNVSRVYLNGLKYINLKIWFKEGKTYKFTCDNFKTEEENQKFIRENLLNFHESLPIGEFAIGTNTTAYVMADKYDIVYKMPILIVEKMGPHFAVGDTCYSHEEEEKTYNPDGKEIIAKENEISALRKEDMQKAYFGCHTDITIPYEEIGEITAVCADGRRIPVIQNGRFVLAGTEELNKPFDEK